MRGHIRQRAPGVWAVVVDLPREPGGRRRQKWSTVHGTRGDAEDTLVRVLHRLRFEDWTGSDRDPVEVFASRWLESVPVTVRANTAAGYRDKLRHLTDRVGSVPLGKVDAPMLNGVYRRLLDDGLSPRSVHHVHTVTRRMLQDAVRWGLLNRNPADMAQPPRVPKRELRVWDTVEVRRFLEHTSGDWLAAMWRVAFTTGMRRSELVPLQWPDIDGDVIRVRRGAVYVRGRVVIDEPKTRASRRSVRIDPVTVAMIRRHRQDQLERLVAAGARSDWLWARDNGRMVSPDWVSRRFRRLAMDAGLHPIPFRDIRHTYATLALRAGVHPKVVSERLGHATVAITLDTYSDSVPSLDADAAALVASLLV